MNKTAKEQINTLPALLEYFKIDEKLWDAIIIGDGSATTWEKELGWGSLLIQRTKLIIEPFYGGMSHGTNNMAEILAVLHPLLYLSQHAEPSLGGCQVHVITDSTYVAQGLEFENLLLSPTLKNNRALWLAVFGTVRQGLKIKAHHVDRDVVDYQKICHDLANLARMSQIGMEDGLKWDVQNVVKRAKQTTATE